MNYQGIDVRRVERAASGGWIALAVAAMLCATAIVCASLAANRTLTVKFAVERGGGQQIETTTGEK